MSSARPDVLVVGAGVSGLTTAVCLTEAGLRVRIVSALAPSQTTSMVAAAMVGPSFTADDPVRGWERGTIDEFTELACEPGIGVRLRTGMLAARQPPPADAAPAGLPRMELTAVDDLPAGFRFGFRATVPLVDMPRYLDYLAGRFRAAGGTMEIRAVESLAAAAREAPLIVNCAGLGARELAADSSVRPVRGQHVVVDNPGLEEFFVEAPRGPSWASYFPHEDHVVLGGVAAEDDWNLEPDPTVAAEILQRCAAIEPRLRGATVRANVVGLRPFRPTVRVDVEQVAGARCVHNYGHGGAGVMLSWGCARTAARLLTA